MNSGYTGPGAVLDPVSGLYRKAGLLPVKNGHQAKKLRVYTDMVADMFHYGHARYLAQCKRLARDMELVVGVHSDATVEAYKRRPICTMQERLECVSVCRYVDEVIPDAPLDVSEEFMAAHNIDVVVAATGSASRFYMYAAAIRLGIYTEVPRTPTISSTAIIARILDRGADSNKQLRAE